LSGYYGKPYTRAVVRRPEEMPELAPVKSLLDLGASMRANHGLERARGETTRVLQDPGLDLRDLV
jgi:hypothetical protein